MGFNSGFKGLILFWSLWYLIYKITGLKYASYFSLCLYELRKITRQIEAHSRFMDVIPRARAVNNAIFFTGCYEIAACIHIWKIAVAFMTPFFNLTVNFLATIRSWEDY